MVSVCDVLEQCIETTHIGNKLSMGNLTINQCKSEEDILKTQSKMAYPLRYFVSNKSNDINEGVEK